VRSDEIPADSHWCESRVQVTLFVLSTSRLRSPGARPLRRPGGLPSGIPHRLVSPYPRSAIASPPPDFELSRLARLEQLGDALLIILGLSVIQKASLSFMMIDVREHRATQEDQWGAYLGHVSSLQAESPLGKLGLEEHVGRTEHPASKCAAAIFARIRAAARLPARGCLLQAGQRGARDEAVIEGGLHALGAVGGEVERLMTGAISGARSHSEAIMGHQWPSVSGNHGSSVRGNHGSSAYGG